MTDLPTGVQKTYFMLSEAERAVLNKALQKYWPGQSEAVFVGGGDVLKPALRLMTSYRLAIDEITTSAITGLGEPAPESLGYGDQGNQRQDRLAHPSRVAGAIRA